MSEKLHTFYCNLNGVSQFSFIYVVEIFQQTRETIDMQDMWDTFVETVERCIFKTEMSRLKTFKKS